MNGRGRCFSRYRFRVTNQWVDGGRTRSIVNDFSAGDRDQSPRTRPLLVESDLPSLLGGDRLVDPLEHLLAALAASVTATLVWHAGARGIHVDAIETRAEGEVDLRGGLGLDPAVRAGYQAIRLTIGIDAKGPDVRLDRLIDEATRLSPVFDTVSRGTPIDIRRESDCQR